MRKTLTALVAGVAMLGSVGAMAVDKVVAPSEDAPEAIGPYSQAVRVGSTLYLAGQLPLDRNTKKLVEGTIGDMTRQSMNNLSAVLAANGMTMENVVMTTIYVTDLKTFPEINKAYGEYFKDGKPPARATVGVAALPAGAQVEIAMIAVK